MSLAAFNAEPLAAREHMVRTDPGALSETTVARIDRRGNPLPSAIVVTHRGLLLLTNPKADAEASQRSRLHGGRDGRVHSGHRGAFLFRQQGGVLAQRHRWVG